MPQLPHRWFHNQFPPFCPVLHCHLGLHELQACPFPDFVFQPLPLYALSSSPFHCALQGGFGQTWWLGDMSIPLQFAVSLRWSGLRVVQLPAGSWHGLLVGNMVCVCNAKYLAVGPHFYGLYSSLALCCDGPWFTSIQESRCDKEAIQSYLGAERNTPVIPNFSKPYLCCCCLCCPGENHRLGTLISYNWAQALEACDCLKLLYIYFNICVDSIDVVCHQLGLLGADLHAV